MRCTSAKGYKRSFCMVRLHKKSTSLLMLLISRLAHQLKRMRTCFSAMGLGSQRLLMASVSSVEYLQCKKHT